MSGIAYIRNPLARVTPNRRGALPSARVVRNGREDLPWYTAQLYESRPRRDAPTPGNKVFPLTDRIWIEEEVIEVFVHGLPRDTPLDELFRKVRVLMLHDPDMRVRTGLRGQETRLNDKPERFGGDLDYSYPDEAMRRFKVIAAPPKLYHAAHKDSAEHIARHGITPGDYGVEKRHVWASLTPERATRAFIDGGYIGSARNVEVYEIDMTGIPTVLRENGYEVVELLKAVADFFDAPHIRAAASRAEAAARGGSYYEDSRIIEGSVPPSRIRKLTHAKANPVDLAGRHIPERYLAGLPPALQKQRIRELTESRDAYKMGDYSELPTDRAARKMGLVKQSAYTTVAKKRGIEYRGDFDDMATRVLNHYTGSSPARARAELAQALSSSFRKGLAAWKSGGHRPGATAQNWAVARVNSLVVGGKTAWTADKKQFSALPDAARGKIGAHLPEVMAALRGQGRQKDVEFLTSILGA